MTSKPVRVGLIGIGGFGQVHLSSLRTLHHDGQCRLVAIADPTADRFPETLAALEWEGVARYDHHDDLLARDDIDAVIIATPIWLHARQTIAALNAGKSVYLEKPPCATIAEYKEIDAARVRSGKVCAIGFQMQSAPVFLYMQDLIRSKRLGELTNVWAGIRWARDDAYYNRALWSGRMAVDGNPVFDGPATNALAHEVHAALALAGAPTRVRGRLLRARPIESFDTAYIEADTERGMNVRLLLTHASEAHDQAYLRLRGTRGQATFTWDYNVHLKIEGEKELNLAFPCQGVTSSLLNFVGSVREDWAPSTPLPDSLPFLHAVHGALQSGKGIASIPRELVSTVKTGSPQQLYTVAGLDAGVLRFVNDPDDIPSFIQPGNWLEPRDISPNLFAGK